MIDDMIDTGGSIASGAQALMDRGAKEVIACCTHAILSSPATQRLQDSCISEVVVLDTVNLPEDKLFPKLTVLSAAPLIAAAIKRINQNTSISELFGQWG
jgi:ribose-phosphate pyrophosphokinase